jgi:5-methylcytosine-specific restriction endonuclease McrA
MKKDKKPLTKTKLQKQTDDLWSLIVRTRDPVCRLCKKRVTKDPHHIFKRGHKATRFDLSNGIGICFRCHKPDGHDDPCNFRERIVAEIGLELYERLRQKSLIVVKYDKAFISEAIDRLKQQQQINQ